MYLRIIISVLVLLLGSAGAAQQGAGGNPPDHDLLQGETTNDIMRLTTVHDAFVGILQGTRLSGGAVSVSKGCSINPRQFHIPRGMRLSLALKQLAEQDGSHQWSSEKGGLVLLIPKAGLPSLLEMKIKDVYFQDTTNLTLSLTELLQAQEVKNATAQLGLKLLPPEIGGFQKLSRSQSKPTPEPLSLHNVSLLAALNLLAVAHPGTVWSYVESDCGGQKSVRIDFINKV